MTCDVRRKKTCDVGGLLKATRFLLEEFPWPLQGVLKTRNIACLWHEWISANPKKSYFCRLISLKSKV